MPIGKYTLLDAVKLHAPEATQEVVNEAAKLSPEMSILPMRTIETTSYKALVRTGNPVVSFRGMNQGVPQSKASFVERLFQTFTLDHQVQIDRAMRDEMGEAGFGLLMKEHTVATLQGLFDLISTQLYYGNPDVDKGFPGLLSQYAADAAHEVDATGTTNKFSIWMLNTSTGNCGLVAGGGRQAGFEQGPWELKDVKDDEENTYQAFCSWLYGSLGFELKNKHAALRGKNFSATESGKGVTDAVLNALWTKAIRNGTRPDTILMPPEGVEQLRLSRTPTNEKGDPVPRPTDWQGIPILETAGIAIGAAGE